MSGNRLTDSDAEGNLVPIRRGGGMPKVKPDANLQVKKKANMPQVKKKANMP